MYNNYNLTDSIMSILRPSYFESKKKILNASFDA